MGGLGDGTCGGGGGADPGWAAVAGGGLCLKDVPGGVAGVSGAIGKGGGGGGGNSGRDCGACGGVCCGGGVYG